MITDTRESTGKSSEDNRETESTKTECGSADEPVINRRSALKLFGLAAVPLAAQGGQAESTVGFAESSYGSGPYGGQLDA